MKKIALTSLLAMIAVSGAHATNVIDGNPLYMPKAGHAYSVTTVGSHSGSEDIKTWGLNEEFGYGVTDKLAVMVSTTMYDLRSFDQWAWSDLTLGMAFRAMDEGNFKLDVLGGYSVSPVWGNHLSFLDKDFTEYVWTAGVRAGIAAGNFTIAGKALFEYWNTESFNWNEKAGEQGVHALVLGLDAQYVIDNNWNLVAGVEYTGIMDDEYRGIPGAEIKNAGTWHGEFGVNYNIDATKFVGAYISGDMNHHGGTKGDEWKVEDGFGFGAKFGIDF